MTDDNTDKKIVNINEYQPADTPAPFSFNGNVIRDDGLMLNLTDMWKAAGRPMNRRPAFWLRLEPAKEFAEHVAKEFGVAYTQLQNDNGVAGNYTNQQLQVRYGGRGLGSTTWAHWQIAIAYAQWISKEFHYWCNTVVRERMERRGVPQSAGPAEMTGLLTEEFTKILENINHRLIAIEDHSRHNRKVISPRTKRQLAEVATRCFRGFCPCCGNEQVTNKDGQVCNGAEADHFHSASLSLPENCWLICKTCHDLFTREQAIRYTFADEFSVFQKRRRGLAMIEQWNRAAKRTAKPSPTPPSA